MCIATAALITGALGAVTSAAGAVYGGLSTADAAHYQSQVAQNNAIEEARNARLAEQAGNANAETTGIKGAEQLGEIKTAQAANNVDVNTGSTVDVQSSQREENQLTTENVLNNANLQAYGYRTQQTSFESQSALDTEEAETAPVGADLAAGGSILSNASSIGFKWGGGGTSSGSLSGTNWTGVG